ncbi:hypothetical protein [uncultured Sphingobacterium sp.]|uniref:hypothetical protein n=1 Tax=uncultured Sphingobacterium sp. TaxID=182688 RepID=UPI003749185C
MKNYKSVYFLLLVLCMLIGCYSSAQTPIRQGAYTVNNIKYYVSKPSVYDKSYGIWRNEKPNIPAWKDIDGFPMDIIRAKITNGDVWKNRVISLLGSQKVQQLKQNTEILGLSFTLKPTGEVYYITFDTKGNTVLTLEDIAKIDRELVNNYIATLSSTQDKHKQLSSISLNYEIDFSKY